MYRVVVAKRDRELASVYASVASSLFPHGPVPHGTPFAEVSFPLPAITSADGVLRVTVYDSKTGLPLAERCVPVSSLLWVWAALHERVFTIALSVFVFR